MDHARGGSRGRLSGVGDSVGCVLLGVLIIMVAAVSCGDENDNSDQTIVGGSSDDAPRISATINVGRTEFGGAVCVTAGDGVVWATNPIDGVVDRIDPLTNDVIAEIDIADDDLGEIASGDGAAWVTHGTGNAPLVSRIDPSTNDITSDVGIGAGSIAIDNEAVWATAWGPGTVTRIDPATAAVLATIAVPGPGAVAVGEGAAWVTSDENSVVRIDPTTNDVTTIAVDGSPFGIAVGEGAVWITTDDDTLVRIDPRTNRVTDSVPVEVDRAGQCAGGRVAAGEGAIWVPDQDGTINVFDARTNELRDKVETGSPPSSVAVGEGAVWVANGLDGDGTIVRIDPGSG